MPTSNDLRVRPHAGPILPGGAGPAVPAGGAPTVSDVLRRYSDGVAPARPRAPAAPVAPARPAEVVPLTEDGGLFLSKTGNLVREAGLDRPRSAVELGDGLFRAAMLAEDGQNIFASPKITLEQKGLALASLVAAFNSANADLPAAGGFQRREQALQVRACAAPLILDLAGTLSAAKPAEAELQRRALDQYLKLLESEKHGLARNFMIFDLDRSKAALPADVRPLVAGLMNEVAPSKPFYDDWFKNGNNTVRVDYHVGNGFWEEETAFYIGQGFARRDNPDGTMTLSKKMVENGVETNFELKMYNGPGAIFRKMNDPNTHIVVYSGHANYGRTVSSRLGAGAPQIGNKVFFGLQCGGKGVHNEILEKYPSLQVVQSKNSSYGHQDRWTLLNSLVGISKRAGWEEISRQNIRENSDNYYFPTDTLVKKRAEDQDGDGIADAWDRVVSYNRFSAHGSVGEELSPRDPGHDARELDGRNLEGALNRFLRIAGYNEWNEGLQNQRVLTDGFYNGKAEDPALKLDAVQEADGTIYRVRINKHYAHASEETLGALLCYEVGRAECARQGLSAADAKGAALLMTAKCLDVDDGNLDQEIWKALLAYAKLPAGISFSDALGSAKEDHDMSAGTARTLESLRGKLRARNIAL